LLPWTQTDANLVTPRDSRLVIHRKDPFVGTQQGYSWSESRVKATGTSISSPRLDCPADCAYFLSLVSNGRYISGLFALVFESSSFGVCIWNLSRTPWARDSRMV
jgi:hypothetical protein